jgi:mannose-6-phosphate isomerase-like protein (cupin superfamily)
MKRFVAASCLLGLCLGGILAAEKETTRPSVPAEWRAYVTDTAELPVEKSPWGTLQWICNAKLSPGALQTLGLAQVYPGKTNVLHYHPNCEEVLHVISGRGIQTVDGSAIELKAGMTVRIPAGSKHSLANPNSESLLTLISFSAGDRQTVFLDGRGPAGNSGDSSNLKRSPNH